MDDGSHLLVVNRGNEVLAAAHHAHDLPSKQSILWHTSVEWTQIIKSGFFSLGLIGELCFCQVIEFWPIVNYHLANIICILIKPLFALNSIECVLVHLLIEEDLLENYLSFGPNFWGHSFFWLAEKWEDVIQTHLTKACQLLIDTQHTLTEEVYLLCFEDATHMHLHPTLSSSGLVSSIRK